MSTRFTALTIKEGDAFLIEDNGWNCLFDSGKDELIVDLLRYKGIDKLDLAICSHNDADHANGFIELLKSGFQIDEIWLPGLWASVLQFVKDNCDSRGEIVCDNEYYNGELDSLFSNESVSCESFNQGLSFWTEMNNSNELEFFCNRLRSISYRCLVSNPEIISNLIDPDLKQQLNNNDYDNDLLEDQLRDYFEEELMDYSNPRQSRRLARKLVNYLILNWKHGVDLRDYTFYRKREDYREYHEFRQSILLMLEKSIDFKLNKIIEVAKLANSCGCTIRWFEPSSTCSKEDIDYGFVSLNSSKMCSIKKLKSYLACFCAISLTKENKYSLVFEFTKNDVPIIRFSADSKIPCQSKYPYPENIIVTAPHHGSAANAVVYKKLQGDDIVWVRSDTVTGGTGKKPRPCNAFKSMKNKYCLACKSFNFISEISFEYDPCHKKWQHIRGEQCRCK